MNNLWITELLITDLNESKRNVTFGIFKRSKLKSEIRKLKKPSVGHKNTVQRFKLELNKKGSLRVSLNSP